MNSLDEVPFKVPMGSLEGPLEEVDLVTAPEICVPDYLQILRETEYEYSLEKWVLLGPQGGYPSAPPMHLPHKASCPPCWPMFSSPQVSRLASRQSSDLWQPTPRPRSRSLSHPHPRVKFIICDPEGDRGYSEDDEGSSTEEDARSAGPDAERPSSSGQGRQRRGLKDARPGSSPRPASPRAPRGLARLQKSSSTSAELRQCSPAPPRPGGPQCHGQRRPRRRMRSLSSVGRRQSLSPQPPRSSPSGCLQPRPSTAGHVPSRKHTPQSLRPYSCVPPPHSVSRPLGSQTAVPDSSAELLSALGQEERELLEAITEQGYPLRTAIIALQKTGRQSLEQILSYLVTCDRLCDLGFDAAQVEEALEMFHNCETKAAEFLHLLAQFHEMGFQQNAIKEVLLVNENHRERALEELMARVA